MYSESVSLHCRVSNEGNKNTSTNINTNTNYIAAIKLYSDCFDYKCIKKVDGYYDDGEGNQYHYKHYHHYKYYHYY